jgi:hypothetical protein
MSLAMPFFFERMPARALTAPFVAALTPSAAAFARALRDPRRAQEQALARLRTDVAALRGVRSLAELRSLPIRGYDDFAEAIAARAEGRGPALSSSPLVRFERSGGSSGPQKLVPMTRASLAEMNRALQPWLWSMYARAPGVKGGAAYWSISPIGQKRETTPAGDAIGADDDAEYFPRPVRRLLSRVIAAPSMLSRFRDVERCRYATLRLLLEREDLALISVWSPTFLTLLMEALDRHLDRLLFDLARGTCTLPGAANAEEHGRADAMSDASWAGALPLRAAPERAARLRSHAARGPLTSAVLWPRLSLLSMWTDASAAAFVDEATARFPGVPLQGKGLLATEGVVSIPWRRAGDAEAAPVLAVRSHVLEFLDARGRAHGAHEIEEGECYDVLLTTGAGLVRYRLGDRARVVGRIEATPCVRFVGRADAVSDLVGEKLASAFVGEVLVALCCRRHTRFAMLAPARGRPARYRLYLEDERDDTAAQALARGIEERLSEGHPYRYARALGQLGPIDVMRVDEGGRKYEQACVRAGQRAGDIKPTPLHLKDGWDDVFLGRLLEVS